MTCRRPLIHAAFMVYFLAALFIGPPARADKLDLVIVVRETRDGRERVGISYPEVVEHAVAGRSLERLRRLANVPVSQVTYDDRPVGDLPPSTAVDFRTAGLVKRDRGLLTVRPFLEAFPEATRLRLVYLVEGRFAFRGPGNYVGPDFRVRFTREKAAFRYDAVRKAPVGATLRQAPGQPERNPGAAAPSPAGARPAWRRLWVALGLLVAALGAGLGGWRLVRRRNGSAAPSYQQKEGSG